MTGRKLLLLQLLWLRDVAVGSSGLAPCPARKEEQGPCSSFEGIFWEDLASLFLGVHRKAWSSDGTFRKGREGGID